MKKASTMMKFLGLFLFVMTCGVSLKGSAVAYDGPDTGRLYPNVVSVRGLFFNSNGTPQWTASGSCSGSLLHIDRNKIVILTAAHCTDLWIQRIATGGQHSVGVSFDLDNQAGGNLSDGTNYVQGGVPLSLPAKDSPFEKLDYGMVVFPRNATNSRGETIVSRWGKIPGALTPVQIAPDTQYVSNLIASVPNPQDNLSFTAVGYGIGAMLPGGGHDLSTFLIRHIATNLTYNAVNPGNDTLRLSMNANKDEGFTCNGDSGGPIFYWDNALGLVQMSLVSGGDVPCRATNTGPGFGKQEAFDFINCGRASGNASGVVTCVNNLFGR